MKTRIREQIEESFSVKKSLISLNNDIEKTILILLDVLKQGNKIMIAGNGGSAADAQHFAAELVGKFKINRQGLACIALTVDSSFITAWSNDVDFNNIFSRQIEALGKPGDVFIGISTSGTSRNILEAVNRAKEMNIRTIGLIGNNGGLMKDLVEHSLIVDSSNTPRIQESHITIIHIICELLEIQLLKSIE
ncbi:MAG: phosphoheptose isomerase [Candidatus Dojkabacteria bacterium]|nr:MAG: phosphoheptose isomerase [Candidatus Dojkabacteria bacterium]